MAFDRLNRIGVVLCGILVLAAVQPAAGEGSEAWPVKHGLLGKHGAKSLDISGIACTTPDGFPRSCVVIDDNSQKAQFVRLKDGELVAGETIKLIDNSFGGERLELDGEGVAFANGFYYVIGSHGHPRDKKHRLDPIRDAEEIAARIVASSQIIRFKPDEQNSAAKGLQRTARLRDIIAAEPALAPFLDTRLEKNGLTIEGVAVTADQTMLVGFRGPVLEDTQAVILAVRIDTLFGGSGTDHRVFRLSLGQGRGIRDLAVFENSVLILAGPVADGPGRYAVYSWNGNSTEVELLKELPFAPERKPEGLLPLDKNASGLRVLILFDGDEEGSPTPVIVPMR